MIKIDIVKRVAKELAIKDKEALAVVDTFIEAMKNTIKEHGRMEIRNFGVFQIKQRKPRTGRNPRNKKEYPIHPRKVVTFKLGKELKDFSVVKPSPQPTPVPQKSSSSSATPSSIQQPSFLPNDGEKSS
jgi:nucleoid DNA-binding protein